MDGYTVARAFRAMSGDAPYLVALTGYAQREDIDRALTAGFDCHVAKPPSLEALERLIGGAPRRRGDEPGVFLH
jgi:CheY-like chemotaxis protein